MSKVNTLYDGLLVKLTREHIKAVDESMPLHTAMGVTSERSSLRRAVKLMSMISMDSRYTREIRARAISTRENLECQLNEV